MTEKPTYEELEKKIQKFEQVGSVSKKAEEELYVNEERLRLAMQATQQSWFDLNLKTWEVTTSPEFASIIGTETEESPTTYQGWIDSIHHKDCSAVLQHFSECLKTGEIRQMEYRMRTRNSEWKWIHSSAKVVTFDENKLPVRMTGTHMDITERKKAEEELRESEEKYRLLANNTLDTIWTTDTEFNITFVNKAVLNSLGYNQDEFIKLNTMEVTTPEGMIVIKKAAEEQVFGYQKGEINQIKLEVQMIRKDGTIIDAEITANPLLSSTGEMRGFQGRAIDITNRKQAEEALRESEEKYRSMMESMKDAAYICSPEMHIEYMNPAMIDRVGADAIGELCYKAIYDRAEKCSWCVFDQVKKGENVGYELANPKNNHYYSISNSPIFHADGNISKLTIFHDITDRKKMEENIQQSQKMQSIGTLAGGIAHDFNNILFPILGHAEMVLMDTPEDSPIRNNINQIYTSALRAKDLVNQILIFSRQGSSELKSIKIQPIIKEALKLIRSTIPTTIEIKQNIPSDCGAIKADPTQIHQIVMNLCTNAYHAMEEKGGELIVSLKEVKLGALDLITPEMTPGFYACLTIADTGSGMDKQLTEKIFEPFFTTKEIGKGTGMGLSVVHGIIKNMNGAIDVYSEPGKGSEFHVYLPLAEAVKEQQATNVEAPIQSGIEQILLVDDEDPILKMEKQMLERLGYQVTSRTSSIEALEAFRAAPEKFDLVITDMAMPNMPGDKLSVELTKIRPDIPVLLCTGFSATMSEEKAASLGIKGFLLKPIIMKDLAHKIREVLDKNKEGK